MGEVLRSRRGIGGKCQHCGRVMVRGEKVHKVDDGRARRWSVKDLSPGSWVCEACAVSFMGNLRLFDPSEVG